MLDPHPVLAEDLFTDAITATEQVLGLKITDTEFRPRYAEPDLLDADREERSRMTWLVTGGAGYIGSHVVRASPPTASPPW